MHFDNAKLNAAIEIAKQKAGLVARLLLYLPSVGAGLLADELDQARFVVYACASWTSARKI